MFVVPPPDRPVEERTDAELMLLASAGAEDAFAALVRRHLAQVQQFATRYLGDAAAGAETAQEALLKVWHARREFRPARPFSVYLYTVVRNLCRNQYRDRVRRKRHLTQEEGVTAHSPLDTLLDVERRRRTLVALHELSPKLKEAVLLRFSQGLDYPEIARILDVPVSTVRSRVFLGIRQLRAHTQEDGE
ncbi:MULTISPECIES: RNA polymerase sigma factor [Myxococcus]|nr:MULTISPECIES: RNA polymerase sigma factor [Myxococcus]MBJ6765917.1 RNA polymerase sigma factor [Myxococcaceae bacterium JPH2]NTX04864.1 RNA polymerase sigma factor [Myxococcus sp. CA040A]